MCIRDSDNRYPGCACDVPSRLYSLSFAPKADWSRDYAPAGEIWDYLRDCVERFGLRSRIVFGAEVTEATWKRGRWEVLAADGREWTAGALVLGVGAVSYTHLDVYKRQPRRGPRTRGAPG